MVADIFCSIFITVSKRTCLTVNLVLLRIFFTACARNRLLNHFLCVRPYADAFISRVSQQYTHRFGWDDMEGHKGF